jgi:hypothetical protein
MNGRHIDPDCEVVRGVGWMCTCETAEEKAEREREREEIEREREEAAERHRTQQPDLTAIRAAVAKWREELTRIGRINTEEDRTRVVPELTMFMALNEIEEALKALPAS